MTSLSRAIQDLNHNVDIVLPKYDCLNLTNVRFIFHFLKFLCAKNTQLIRTFKYVQPACFIGMISA